MTHARVKHTRVTLYYTIMHICICIGKAMFGSFVNSRTTVNTTPSGHAVLSPLGCLLCRFQLSATGHLTTFALYNWIIDAIFALSLLLVLMFSAAFLCQSPTGSLPITNQVYPRHGRPLSLSVYTAAKTKRTSCVEFFFETKISGSGKI